MRYLITKDFRKLILLNQEELSLNLSLKSNIKNLIYKNKTISLSDLNKISKILDLNDLNLKKIFLSPHKNLGKHSQSPKINFTGKNKRFAELIGIILGDGNLYNNMLRITLSKNERAYLDYVKSLVYDLFGVIPGEYFSQRSNTITLSVYNKNLSELLMKNGIKRGNKVKNQVGIPNWIKNNSSYALNCLKGLIDTDGCAYTCKRDKKNYIKFTNHSKNLINDVLEISKNHGFEFKSAGKYNICLYKEESIAKYLKKVGFSNEKHINRWGRSVAWTTKK